MTDAWLAYQYDTAANVLGRWVQAMCDARDDKGKLKHRLSALLAGRDTPEGKRKQYRSAAHLAKPAKPLPR